LLLPSAVLAFAAASKLKGAYAAFYIQHLTTSELTCNVILPLVEFFVAVGLVLYASRSVFPAAIAFSVYIGYLIQVKISGGNSCNCFGGYEQDIRFVMALDFICLGVLLISNPSRNGLRSFRLPAAIVVAIPISALLWVCNPGLSKLVSESFSPGPLRSFSRAGSSVVATTNFKSEVEVTNRSRNTLRIRRILATCGCTTLSPTTLTLEPGESKTLSVTIDLTKSYSVDQSSAQHHIIANCYEEDENLVGEISLFKGRSFRTYGVENRKRVFSWREESPNELEIPITWFSASETPVECSMNGEVVGSARFLDPIRLRVDRPVSFFEKRKLTLSHTVNAASTITEMDLSVVAKPDEVTCAFRPWNDTIELNSKQGFENVEVRILDLKAQLIEHSRIIADEKSQNDTFVVTEPRGVGSSYFDLTVFVMRRQSHRIIIPFSAGGTSSD